MDSISILDSDPIGKSLKIPNKIKNASKSVEIMMLLIIEKVNLDKVHDFLLFSNPFFIRYVSFYKAFKAGSGSALKKQLDPDSQ